MTFSLQRRLWRINLTLATRNHKHFDKIAHLTLLDNNAGQ